MVKAVKVGHCWKGCGRSAKVSRSLKVSLPVKVGHCRKSRGDVAKAVKVSRSKVSRWKLYKIWKGLQSKAAREVQ